MNFFCKKNFIKNSLAALADGVCCSTWLKGRQPFISLEQFQQHWGEQGALYQVSTAALYQPGTTPQLTVLWTVQHPTPIQWGLGGDGWVRRLLAPLGGVGSGWVGWPGRRGWGAWWFPVLACSLRCIALFNVRGLIVPL